MKYFFLSFLLGVLLSCNSGPKNKTFSKAEFDSAMNETHIKVDVSPDFGGAYDTQIVGSDVSYGSYVLGESVFSWGDTTHHLKKKKHRRKPDLGQIEEGYPDTWEPSPLDTLKGIDTSQFAPLHQYNILTITDSGKIVASRDSAGKWTIIDGQATLGILTKLLLSADSSLQKCKP